MLTLAEQDLCSDRHDMSFSFNLQPEASSQLSLLCCPFM